MLRHLIVVFIINYLWLMFGSSIFAGTAPWNIDKRSDSYGGIISAKDGWALKSRPVMWPWNGGNHQRWGTPTT